MIVDKKTLVKMKDFGLNSYESKIWTALLSRGVSTAGELSDIANVPRSRSYDVLETLEKKGFVVMKLGKPIKYLAIPPGEAIERVKKNVRKDAEVQESLLEELRNSDILQELSLLHSQGVETQDPTELTGSIKGRDNIHNHLEFQIKNAKETILLSTTEQGIKRKTKSLIKHLRKAKERGVKIKVVAPFSDATKSEQSALSEVAELVNSKNASRFCVIDTTKATVMLMDDVKVHPSYDLAIWVHSPYFSNTLVSSVN